MNRKNFSGHNGNENELMSEKAFALFILPLMLSNVFQQLYVPVNAAIVGRIRSTADVAVIGACSFTAMMQGFIFGGISTGFGICLCEYAGSGDPAASSEDHSGKTVSRMSMGWTGALFLTGILTVLGIAAAFAAPVILIFLRVPIELREMALPYMAVLLAGSGPSVLKSLMIWLLQSQKRTAGSGLISAVSVVTQTALTVFFIGVLRLPVWASALATALNHLLIAGIVGLMVRGGQKRHDGEAPDLLPASRGGTASELHLCRLHEIEPAVWTSLIRGGTSKCAMKVLTGLGALPRQLVLNSCNVDQIAGYTVAMSVSNIPQVILGAYGTCAAVLWARHKGAGELGLLKREARRLFVHSSVMAAVLTALMVFLGYPILRAVAGSGASADVIRAGYQVLAVSSAGFIGLAVYCVGHFGLQGIGDYRIQVWFGVISMGTQLAALALAAPVMGFAALPFATMLSWVLPGVVAVVVSGKEIHYGTVRS